MVVLTAVMLLVVLLVVLLVLSVGWGGVCVSRSAMECCLLCSAFGVCVGVCACVCLSARAGWCARPHAQWRGVPSLCRGVPPPPITTNNNHNTTTTNVQHN